MHHDYALWLDIRAERVSRHTHTPAEILTLYRQEHCGMAPTQPELSTYSTALQQDPLYGHPHIARMRRRRRIEAIDRATHSSCNAVYEADRVTRARSMLGVLGAPLGCGHMSNTQLGQLYEAAITRLSTQPQHKLTHAARCRLKIAQEAMMVPERQRNEQETHDVHA